MWYEFSTFKNFLKIPLILFILNFRMNAVRSLGEYYLYDTKRNALSQEDKNNIIDGLLSKLETKESLEVKSKEIYKFLFLI